MLLTKLNIPVPGKNLVHRSLLFDKLSKGLSCKLILISAPAGFGKTTLLSDWITQRKIPAVWFSIGEADNDPVEFINHIIAGIQNIDEAFGKSALHLLKSQNRLITESISKILINDIHDIQKDFLLVLDDFHLINNLHVFELVSYLLEYLPANIHIAISTRSDPTIKMARLRSQNQLIEIRSSELSFSKSDISQLFNNRLNLKLSLEDLEILENKTEGWIAGLQLAALSMQSCEDRSAFVESFAGNNRYIMDYLIEEVLQNQSKEVTEFLLSTSNLDQISAQLCDAVLNKTNSQEILDTLEKQNMFVFALDEDRQWYRYHHLFADLLKQRFLLKNKSILENLHSKASEWFEKNEIYDLAIDHALKIKFYEKSICILDQIIDGMWKDGKHSAILKYGEIIPDQILYNYPNFCLYYSWILISAGEIKKAEPFLIAAEKLLKIKISDTTSSELVIQSDKKLLGKISVAFAYLHSNLEHTDKIFEYCKTAMDNLSENDPLWYSWAWFSYGVAYLSDGELNESKKAFNKAFVYGKKTDNIYLISTIVIRMAEIEQQLGHYKEAYKKCYDLLSLINEKGYSQITKAEWTYAPLYFIMGVTELGWAEIDKAVEKIGIAYDLSKKGNDHFLKIYVLIVYSIILKFLDDPESEKMIAELENLMKSNTIPPFLNSYFLSWKIYLLMDQNQIEEANDLISDFGLELNKEINHANEIAYSAYARLLIKQNKLNEAETLLSELYSFVSSYNGIERMIELNISYTILYEELGNTEKAVKCLMTAMEMSSKEEGIFEYVFQSDNISSTLDEVYKIQSNSETKIPQKFIDKLQHAINGKVNRKKNLGKTELSLREMDTLKLMGEDLSNQEIADKLFISLNTVKTHVRKILQKLEVEKRSQAVSKAKELDLI